MTASFTRGPRLWALATVLSLLVTVFLPGILARGQDGFGAIGTAVFVVMAGGILSLAFAISAGVSGWRRRGGEEAAPGVYTWGPLLLCVVGVLLLVFLVRLGNKETASPDLREPTAEAPQTTI